MITKLLKYVQLQKKKKSIKNKTSFFIKLKISCWKMNQKNE